MSAKLENEENYGISLYHPYIHVRNPDWLKCNLLYWDGIRRIVPENFIADEKDEKRPEVLSVIQAGLLIRTDPRKYVEEARNLFLQRLSQLRTRSEKPGPSQGLELLDSLASHSQAKINANEFEMESLKEVLRGINTDQDEAYVDILNGKMHDQLAELLREVGLARAVKGADYMMVQRTAADFYMSCLATVMKQQIGSPMVTDATRHDDLGKFLDYGAQGPSTDRIGVLLDLDIPFPTPESLHDISMKKILDLHKNEDFASERRRFRKAAEKMVAKAAKAQAIDQFQYEDFLKDETKAFRDAFQSHQSQMKTIGIKAFGSMLKVGAPTLLTSLPGVAKTLSPSLGVDPLGAGILAGTGILLSLVVWWAEVRQQRQLESKNDWHYLLSLQKATRTS